MKQEFLEKRAERNRQRGYRVFGLLPGLRPVPRGWVGPAPDLYVEKGRSRVAKLVRTEAELKDPRTLEAVLSMLDNPGLTVRLFVFSRKSLRAAKALRAALPSWSLRQRVQVFPVRKREGRPWRAYDYYQRHRLEWAAGVSAVLVGVVLLAKFHFLGPAFSAYFGQGIEAGLRSGEEGGLIQRLQELERRLERMRGAGQGGEAERRTWQGMTGERTPGGAPEVEFEQEFRRFKEIEAKAMEELRRRATQPGQERDAQQEAKRLKELEDRAMDEMRKRGITLEDLRKRGIVP